MKILLVSLISLLLAFLCHLAWWRIRLPKRQLRTLLLIFGTFFLLILGGMVIWPELVALPAAPHWISWLYVTLFYWAAAFCYVITYSAMEGDSPTLSLMRYLHKAGPEGVSHDDIEEFFRQRPFVGARLKALVHDGVFLIEEKGYRLSPGNYTAFRLILGYRRVVFGRIKSGG